MFNISKLVNKITERGGSLREDGGSSTGGSRSSSLSFVRTEEEQHSEGFLCPPCMRAFPSPEALEEHYHATHGPQTLLEEEDAEDGGQGDVKLLRDEIQSLQLSLADEKVAAEELKREVRNMQIGLQADEQMTLLEAQEKEFEGVKAILSSEVELLRAQLLEALGEASALRKDKESLTNQIKEEVQIRLATVKSMEEQLELTQKRRKEEEEEEMVEVADGGSHPHSDNISKEQLRLLQDCMEVCMKEKEEEIERLNTTLTEINRRKGELEEECEVLKEEVRRLNEQHSELVRRVEGGEGAKAALESLSRENELLRRQVEEGRARTEELHSSLLQEREDQEGKVSELTKRVEEWERKAVEVAQTNAQLSKTLEEQSKELSVTRIGLRDAEKARSELQETLAIFGKESAQADARLKAKLAELTQKSEATREAAESEIRRLQGQLAEVQIELSALKEEGKGKQVEWDALEKELQGRLEKVQVEAKAKEETYEALQSQSDCMLKDKLEVEARLKGVEEERALLLEKCLGGEMEVEEMRGNMSSLQRRLDEAHAALQELGRENQSLQMESAKLQGRKWADDSLITLCTACGKDFSLTIRKHHCRHCGQIFCGECSSRTAQVASCKKPARVCDPCYQELLTK